MICSDSIHCFYVISLKRLRSRTAELPAGEVLGEGAAAAGVRLSYLYLLHQTGNGLPFGH